MGYTTEFTGSIAITPPLNPEEIAYLNKFSDTRRMDREKGPYFVDGTDEFGQGKDPDIHNYNSPPPSASPACGANGFRPKMEPRLCGTKSRSFTTPRSG